MLKHRNENNSKIMTKAYLAIIAIALIGGLLVACFGATSNADSAKEIAYVTPATESVIDGVLGERLEEIPEISEDEVLEDIEDVSSEVPMYDNLEPIPEEPVVVHVCNYSKVLTVNPSCVAEGKIVYRCSCGDEKTEILSIIDHDTKVQEISATCIEDGSRNEVCVMCGDIIRSKVIPAFGHTEGTWEVLQEANCTQGYHAVLKCTVCNEEIMGEASTPIGHDWETTAVILGTCNSFGSVAQECTVCGETQRIATPYVHNAHISVEKEVVESTCTSEGCEKTVCSGCGEVISEEIIPMLEHTEGTWEVIHEATCSQGYEAQCSCAVCGEVFMFEMSTPLPHEWKTIEVVSSDCTTNGYVHQKCEICGEEQKIALPPSAGHLCGESVYEDDPRSPYYGAYVLYCEICGEVVEAVFEVVSPPVSVDEVHGGIEVEADFENP